MSYFLSELATVKGGYPFRGRILASKNGNACAVQIRDINEHGEIEWEQLVRTNLSGRRDPDWLAEGDILFAARGQRNFAVCVNHVNARTVCGAHFFLVQVHPKTNMLPSFLAWQLNQLPAQKYITQSAEGSAQLSIRRAVLEATPLTMPSLEEQHAIVALDEKVKQEKKLLVSLIENRTKQMQGIAQKVLTEN